MIGKNNIPKNIVDIGTQVEDNLVGIEYRDLQLINAITSRWLISTQGYKWSTIHWIESCKEI